MKTAYLFLLSFSFFLLLAKPVIAQVKINEFSSDTSDWIEIFSTSAETIDLTNYRLRDSTDSNKKDLSGSLLPGNFLSISFSNYLNKDTDSIKLIVVSGGVETIIDEVAYGGQDNICAPNSVQSIGRKPDGTGGFVRFSSQTQGVSNTAAEEPCPLPSPSPAASPNPSPSPSPAAQASPSPIPSPIASKAPSPSPKASASPSPAPEPSPEEEIIEESPQILGASASAKPTNPYRVAFVLIGLGLALIGASAWGIMKHGKMAKS